MDESTVATPETERLSRRLSGESRSKSLASSAYRYLPLDTANNEIRLLHLHTGQNSTDPICCEIRSVRLRDAGEYIALSYAWGDTTRTRTIFLNGCNYEITANLEEFFRQMQATGTVSALWVDAICINQEDLIERSSQVSIMRNIYSSAVYVIAWLGTSDDDTIRVFEFVEGLAKEIRDGASNVEAGLQGSAVSSWIASHTSLLLEDCPWRALADLFHRPWWNRAWIVQEVILAQGVRVMCGQCALSWGCFELASNAVFAQPGTIITTAASGYTNDTHPTEMVLLHSRFRRLCDGANHVNVIRTTAARRKQFPLQFSFYEAITTHLGTDATNPLDKIYAFLGLTLADYEGVIDIPVDYKTSPALLYRTVTKTYLTTKMNLNILNECYGIGRLEGFASWSPQFNKRPEMPVGGLSLLEYPPHIEYKAAWGPRPQFSFDSGDEVLQLAGVLFDSVKVVGEIYDLRSEETICGLRYTPDNVRKTWAKLAGVRGFTNLETDETDGDVAKEGENEMDSADALYPDGTYKLEAWFRTLLCNPAADVETDYFDPRVGINTEWRQASQTPGSSGMNDDTLKARLGMACFGRRFYITESGYYGLGPPVTSIGDDVCVFLGGKSPFLLRRSGDSYEIVCETYVQGLMSGEVLAQIQYGSRQAEMISLR